MRKEIPGISLGMVYRNLKLLKQRGSSELILAGAVSRFDGIGQNHYLLDVSNAVAFLISMSQVDKDIDERIAQKTNFKVF